MDEVLGREPGGQRAWSRASSDADALNFVPLEQPSGSPHRWPNIEDWMLDGSHWMGDSSGLLQGFEVQSPPLIDLTSPDRASEGKLQVSIGNRFTIKKAHTRRAEGGSGWSAQHGTEKNQGQRR